MADDWFAQNAPKAATPKADSTDWFTANAPGPTNSLIPRPPKVSNELPEDLPETLGKFGLSVLPAIGATAATIAAPEIGLPMALTRMGASALGGALGSGVQQGIEKAAGKPISGDEFMRNVITEGGINGLSEGFGQVLNKVAGATLGRLTPERLYQSSLKPSGDANSIKKMVRAGLDARIPVDEKAMGRATQKINDIENQTRLAVRNRSIAPSTVPGVPVYTDLIDPKTTTSGLTDLRTRYTAGTGDPRLLKEINTVERNYLLRHSGSRKGGKRLMSPEEALDAKKGLYDEINLANTNAYKAGVRPGLDTQAKQEIASGLLNEIVRLHPELRQAGQMEGGLIELKKALNGYVRREGNKQIIPLLLTIATGTGLGSLAGHSVEGAGISGGIAGMQILKNALDSPEVKSRIAIALNRVSKSGAGKAAKFAGKYGPGTVVKLGADALTNYDPNAAPPPPPPPPIP